MNSKEFVLFSHYTVLNDPQKKQSVNGEYYVFMAANNRQRIPCLCFDSMVRKVESLGIKKGSVISFAGFEEAYGIKDLYDYKVIDINVPDPNTGLTDFCLDYRVSYTIKTEPSLVQFAGNSYYSFLAMTPRGSLVQCICRDEMVSIVEKLKLRIDSVVNFCGESFCNSSEQLCFDIKYLEFYEKPSVKKKKEIIVDLSETLRELQTKPFLKD